MSSIGDASSLTGGELLLTPLFGEDGLIAATGQGPLGVGGYAFGSSGPGGETQSKNHPTSGALINGVKLLQDVGLEPTDAENLHLCLASPDNTSAQNMTDAINVRFPGSATALDSATVRVRIPDPYRQDGSPSRFLRDVEQLTFEPDQAARVVINERTGTIVFGNHVRISSVAVSHGNLTVSIKNTEGVSQPEPFSRLGTTERMTDQETAAAEEKAPVHLVPDVTTVDDLVAALNALGATPRDIMMILHALRGAGALHASLESI